MPDHFQLTKFDLSEKSGGDALVLVSGSRRYYDALRSAFRQHRFSRLFEDKYERFDWGTFVYNADKETCTQISNLLELFKTVVFLDDALTQTFALDYHYKTQMGKLVYAAKLYPTTTTPVEILKSNALLLVDLLENFMRTHLSYLNSDFIVPVPS